MHPPRGGCGPCEATTPAAKLAPLGGFLRFRPSSARRSRRQEPRSQVRNEPDPARASVDTPTGSVSTDCGQACGSRLGGRQETQVSDQEQVWTAVAHQLRNQLTEAVWYSTFGGVIPLEANGEHLAISVPSNHVRDRILTRYLPLVTEALDEVLAPGCSLDIVVADPPPATSRSPSRSTGSTRCVPSTDASGALDGTLDSGPYGASLLDEAGLNPALHVRDVRQGRLQPVRPRRRAARRRDARPLVQPAVHLRRRRPRQDPPAARHRALRAPQLPAPRGALRLHRDVPQRVRRRHPHQHRQRLQAALPGDRRAAHRRHPVPREPRGAPGGVLPHVQHVARREQADRHLLRPGARRDRHARGAPARPLQVGPDHRRPAARSRDPAGHPAQQGRARPGGGAVGGARVHRHQGHRRTSASSRAR